MLSVKNLFPLEMKLLSVPMMAAGTMLIAGALMGASARLMVVLVLAKSYLDSHDRDLGGSRG